MFKDIVKVTDSLLVKIRNKLGSYAAHLIEDGDLDKPVVTVKGWVEAITRCNGKTLTKRSGYNIWTNTGREYLSLRSSWTTFLPPPNISSSTPFRTDGIAYIGVGTGSQVEDVNVLRLANPVGYDSAGGTVFLKGLEVPPTFPLSPNRTTVRHRALFTESEISNTPSSTVFISEFGLFSSGDPQSSYAPRTSGSLAMSVAEYQRPFAYKTFEPIPKTDAMELEVLWDIKF